MGTWIRRRYRRVVVGFVAAAVVLAVAVSMVYNAVQREGRPVVWSVEAAPQADVAIVFGAGVDANGTPCAILADRIKRGVELYKAGKARKLLMTGDNSRVDYNEPQVMRQQALKLGVPDRDIVLDYAGFRTYDSLYRARSIFGVRRALLVSQGYHLPRAIYTARRLGLDVVGVAARHRAYPGQTSRNGREFLSTLSAWIETNIQHPHPKYLGKPEPIL